MPVRVGFDLVSVADVQAELAAPTGDRYLARIFSEGEVAACRTDAGVSAERLAARFAAKEATLKVLPASDIGLSFRDIEVRQLPAGGVELLLHGAAEERARSARIVALSLSLTHEAGMAGAVVVAEVGAG